MRACFLLVLFLFAIQSESHTIWVVTGTENGPGSLSEAINNANSSPGSDTIVFAIPISNTSFDAVRGIFTIQLTTLLPAITDTLFMDAGTQTINIGNTNAAGPEICITTSDSMLVSRGLGVFAAGCRISGFLINGFQQGIVLSEPFTNNCTISRNFVGVNYCGNAAEPNQYGIVLYNGVSGCRLDSNLISGNSEAGILLKNSHENTIQSNRLGTSTDGHFALANRFGILLDSASQNSIVANIISGNEESGVLISGRSSVENQIHHNLIGTDSTGSAAIPNLYGITLSKAGRNTIGPGNLISGNNDIGVLLTGKYTCSNTIAGNLIGTDLSGTSWLGNHKGIVIKSLSNSNMIGGLNPQDRNVISGNTEIGIYIEAADSNRICGNYIGTDISGMNKIALGSIGMNDSLVQGNGVEFNILASHNILGDSSNAGRNIISGHKVYGVVYYGHCNNNTTINNFIGTDVTGQNALPNATGICFDCASNHNDVINCVLSGNIGYGLFFVTRGTEYNRLIGCKIGTDSTGTLAVPNDIGMVVSTGAAHNIIGGPNVADRNLFSGNLQSGLMLTNQLTEYNWIENNYFGTDISGTLPLPNLFGMLITTFASKNMIIDNVISGNTSGGMVITEQADSNLLMRNRIGTASAGLNPLPNGGCAIFIDNGARDQRIGTPDSSNVIAFHESGGILIKHDNCTGNRISGNRFRENNGPAIDIFPFGVLNPNDSSDTDEGPAQMMNSPMVLNASYDDITGYAQIEGLIETFSPAGTTVQIYQNDGTANSFAQGWVWLGEVIPDSNGNWDFVSNMLSANSQISAICIDADGNTSEFSQSFGIISGVPEPQSQKPRIFPNPCSGWLNIETDEPVLKCSLFSTDGKEYECLKTGLNTAGIDLTGFASGIYILNVQTTYGSALSLKIIKD